MDLMFNVFLPCLRCRFGRQGFQILAAITMMACLTSYGQQQPKFKHYTVDDGLDQNFTASIVQDRNGFIWFNNFVSLARFDGYEFKMYRHTNNDPLLQLGPGFTGSLITDDNYNLWLNGLNAIGLNVLTGNRLLQKYDPAKDGFISYKPEIESFLRCLAEEKDSTVIWLGTGIGLFSFNTTTGKTFQYPYPAGQKTHELNGKIRSINVRNTYLQLGTNNGLWHFDKSEKRFFRPKVNPRDSSLLLNGAMASEGGEKGYMNWKHRIFIKADSLLNIKKTIEFPADLRNEIIYFDIDENGIFLISAGGNHLVRFDSELGVVDTLLMGAVDTLRTSDSFVGVKTDRDNNVWCYDGNGAMKYLPPEFPYSNSQVQGNFIGIYELKGTGQSRIIHLNLSNQLDLLTRKDGEWNSEAFTFPNQNDQWSNFNFGLQGKTHFWVGTWGRGVIGFPIDHENATLKRDGIIFYNRDTANTYTLGDHAARGGIYEDETGNVWTGTYTAGLNKINRKMKYGSEGAVEKFLHQPNDTTSICSNQIEALVPDIDGTIWLGTPVGLDLFKDGKFKHLLKGYFIYAIYKTTNGDFYISTTNGTFSARKTGEPVKFTRINSLNTYAMAEDGLNRLWFTSSKGLVMYDPIRQMTINFGNQEAFKFAGTVIGLPNGEMGFFSSRGSIAVFDPLSFKVE